MSASPSAVRHLRLGPVSLRWSPRVLAVSLAILTAMVAVAVLVLTTGTIAVAPADIVPALFGQGDPTDVKVVRDLRLPRYVTGALVGACLGMSGAVIQSIARNPLGSPDVIGFTTGAATGAIVQIIVLGGGALATGAWAVGGGIVAALAVYVLSYRGGATGGYRLILVGIGVGAMLHAVNALLITRADLDTAISAQVWLNGSLNVRTWDYVGPVLLGVVLLAPATLWFQRRLSLMEMGDDASRQLGVRVERVRLTVLALAVALAAVAVAAAGPISFIALAAAPLVKRLTRHPSPGVGTSALMGAFLLVSADALTQVIPWDYAVPVGVMTGLLGGIYLAWLLGRSRI